MNNDEQCVSDICQIVLIHLTTRNKQYGNQNVLWLWDLKMVTKIDYSEYFCEFWNQILQNDFHIFATKIQVETFHFDQKM
jgi:hypothetical protein